MNSQMIFYHDYQVLMKLFFFARLPLASFGLRRPRRSFALVSSSTQPTARVSTCSVEVARFDCFGRRHTLAPRQLESLRRTPSDDGSRQEAHGCVAGHGTKAQAQLQVLPLIKKPIELIGKTIKVPGSYWEGTMTADEKKQLYVCIIRATTRPSRPSPTAGSQKDSKFKRWARTITIPCQHIHEASHATVVCAMSS